jgi:hypothetical protein
VKAALSITVLTLASSAAATDVVVPKAVAIEEKNLVAGKVSLDPAKGYIFLRGKERQFGVFIRVPDQEDRDGYQKEWEKRFIKAKKAYPTALERWRMDAASAAELKRKPPRKPVEPTRETFSIGPVEQRTMESFGPVFVYAKDPANKAYSYLTAVKPGTYIWYGPIMLASEGGYAGICACMGSVKFEVKPGIVTDLGNFLTTAPKIAEQDDAQINDLRDNPAQFAKFEAALAENQGEPSYGLPASLRSWPSARAEFSASGKIDNFLGVMVSRLPPIPGILAYQRDTVIDVRTNTPVSSRTMSDWRSRR